MQSSLRTRLTYILLWISIAPLLFSAILGIQQNVSSQINQAIAQQTEVASRVAIQTEEYINATITSLKALIDIYDIHKLPLSEQESILRNTVSFSEVLDEITITDAYGIERVKVSRDTLVSKLDLRNVSTEPSYTSPSVQKKIYLSEISFDEKSGLPFMVIGIPIIDVRSDGLAGVLIAKLRFEAVWGFMTDAAENGRSVYMIDSDDRVVAHSNPSITLQGSSFSAPAEGVLAKGLDNSFSVLGRSDIALAEKATFSVFSEVPWNIALRTSLRFIRISLTVILLTVGVIYLLSLRLSRGITDPIEKLATAAEAIQGGNLKTRVNLRANDELGLLGETFNRMAEQLQDVLAGLEARISERTEELEESLRENKERSTQLETIATAARAIASLENVDDLLPNITRLVSERFGFYHAGIFLLDEDKKFAVLRASNSDGGRVMLDREHKLRIGQQGVVGYAAASKKARIALDVGEDAVYFNNPDLPETHSEMALPLLIGQDVIGILDIQSKEAGAFEEDDIDVLSTLADQIAIAIQNAHLFAQSQTTLEELERTFRQYVRSEWTRFIETSDVKGYVAQQSGIQPIREASLQKDDKPPKSNTIYPVAVKLRDVTVGHVNVDLGKPIADYSPDELDIIHAAVERFTLALENARLLETTTRRARRERLVSEITTKIRSTNDPDEMVKTAMEELKKVLGASKVELQAYQPDSVEAESSQDE